jgi:hypothetical protein
MIFENEDILCELAKHMNGLDLITLLKVNKNIFEFRNNPIIQKNIKNFIEMKVIRIQSRFRKYLDKTDFLSGITEKAHHSINNLNIFLEEEFCLVDKYYLTYRGDIGTLILTLIALYGDVSIFGGENVSIEDVENLQQIAERYLR